ncbi:MAG: hypothetical protein A2527_01730 [Candidatus Lambdaproteobacteria bacterium RIFOXYD2_FULL_50_16]|uniref:NAD-dependent epimerase/dehydratase domain-containing protein n=1 Tax=Candidatus Lambdaproteobacteria bacterium RIFOXYD2_FULL_50_16 TaxID=1817772 RepID=A0A1F6G5V7_9PROT|nr:MAG: hypothetical protein A2527_01730 [Candidatus Lambdaproteobacteria bacterium RIFOXYD2_FULL_50_16]
MHKVLVTGAAGFIGSALSLALLKAGYEVVGIDNLCDYYEVSLKEARLKRLEGQVGFSFIKMDLADYASLSQLFQNQKFDTVVNLAAQVGVRYSLSNPEVYTASNLVGFANVLEACRRAQVKHLVYASSSSVYGANVALPFSEEDPCDQPISYYGATKRSNEMMAHSYAHLYGLRCTGLRFFTVYGPWGRPDMAIFLFTKAILKGESIKVFNQGQMRRDFTYVDDIVEGICQLLKKQAEPGAHWPKADGVPNDIFNIGNHQPIQLMDMIRTLEEALGIEAKKELMPMQDGDMVETFSKMDKLQLATGFMPATLLKTGIENFVAWYRSYYGV